MFSRRIKIFIAFSIAMAVICMARLVQLQIISLPYYREQVDKLKLERSRTRQLNTVRGRILDRKGRVLATDEPKFQLLINYQATCYLDERVRQAKLIAAAKTKDPETAGEKAEKIIIQKLESLNRIIDKCAYFGLEREKILEKIQKINDDIWNLREYLTWRPVCGTYQQFIEKYPDSNERLLKISKTDIADMYENYSLLELNTDEEVFKALYEFMDISEVSVSPEGYRVYPYGSVACQTIGWVGPENERKLFTDDDLLKYLPGEVSGRLPGVEYVCEAILRGRRGELVYDIDRNLVKRTETQLGRDVTLTLDIELQKKIEDYLIAYPHAAHCKGRMASVVIDIYSGDILALVSIPGFDLNTVRKDYEKLKKEPGTPLTNRAINNTYPPGSVIKPLIAIAGLETGKITTNQTISCPASAPPKGWPRCWIQRTYSWLGHDDQWSEAGGNNTRNAIRGSCNIYFSRLADRIDSEQLQKWLFAFGYGHDILMPPAEIADNDHERNMPQSSGIISSKSPAWGTSITSLEQLKELPIEPGEKRFFGIGQGNCRVTPLQVVNSISAIARGGIYKNPRLYIEDPNNSLPDDADDIDMGISKQTLDAVRDGLSAVVNQVNGTAYRTFSEHLRKFAEMDVKIYGKTGSTQAPETAWFAGFAEDSTGRSIAIALVIEGGQSGAQDASPLVRDIITFCVEQGCLGKIIARE